MEKLKEEDLVQALNNMTIPQLVALTKQLEEAWGVKAVPSTSGVVQQTEVVKTVEQTEFNVTLISAPADKKMSVIKAVREVLALGLKESKELVEAAPKLLKEAISKEDADNIRTKLTEAGAVIEVK